MYIFKKKILCTLFKIWKYVPFTVQFNTLQKIQLRQYEILIFSKNKPNYYDFDKIKFINNE